jgi:erythromycin esterase
LIPSKGGLFSTLKIPPASKKASAIKQTIKAGRVDDAGRDARMAANLAWLVQHKFKGQKIMVWAADIHIAKNIDPAKYYSANSETMGSKFMEGMENPDQVYILGFTSYEGMGGRVGSPGYIIKNRIRNSFETWFTAQQSYAFVDFKAFNQLHPGYLDPFYAMPISHVARAAPWNQVFDGLFYIRDMYRCIPTRSMKVLSFFGP